MIDSIIFVK